MNIIVTGGAGFIGSALIRLLIEETDHHIVNVDKLTYAGHLSSLDSISSHHRYRFYELDICDTRAMHALLASERPQRIVNLAAESHVDRSIQSSREFLQTNVIGTFNLLEASLRYWIGLGRPAADSFLFHQVSTDEVFGSLGDFGQFSETSRYDPRSPYSASKASADHFVRAWHHTYGMPTIVSNCSNNYGPYQFPEKLIPLCIHNALNGKPLPVYGQGLNVRDWLYVEDHARALATLLLQGKPGSTYVIGGNAEKRNIEIVRTICSLLESLNVPKPKGVSRFEHLIQQVADRPGHDYRYAVNAERIQQELGWQPRESFESGIEKTVKWYLTNADWCHSVLADAETKRAQTT